MKGDIGRRVRELRLKRGLTQAGLGDKSGVSGSAIKELEAGRTESSPALHRIAKALGTTPEQLEGQRGAPAPTEDYEPNLMRRVLMEVESATMIARSRLAPDVKADLVLLVYRTAREDGQVPGKAMLLELVRQAAA